MRSHEPPGGGSVRTSSRSSRLAHRRLQSDPAGDDVQIDASDTLGIEVQPATVTFSEVTVQATGITVDAIAAELDFAGVDSTLVDRIQSGIGVF